MPSEKRRGGRETFKKNVSGFKRNHWTIEITQKLAETLEIGMTTRLAIIQAQVH